MQTKSKISAYILRGAAAALLISCVIVALSSAISVPRRHPAVPASQNSTAFGVNGRASSTSVAASATRRDRTLTFADRVAYQRMIEEVYWRHRIWPAANAGPKPPLDRVMPQEAIEKKVKDYLRDSQALEDYWQKPITPDQLQAEMERIASHTKQPGVLRELFAALGNDPLVIAECLARPVLAERLLTQLYAHDQRFHGELKRRAEAELRTHRSMRQMKQTSGMYTEMEWIKSDAADVPPNDASDVVAASQRGVARDVPQARGYSESAPNAIRMNSSEWKESIAKLAAQFDRQGIVGQAPRLANGRSAAGAAALQKPPEAQIKTGVLSPVQEDDAHYYAVAVMKKGKGRLKLATVAWLKEPLRSWLAKAETQVPVTMAAVGPNYYTLPVIGRPLVNSKPSGTCTNDTWTPTSLTGAPVGRFEHTAVWTGSEMIVWGGQGSVSPYVYNTGGRYNPSTDSWTATSTTNAPEARWSHTAVWTGSEMIVWGGDGNTNELYSGGRYNPATDSWTATSLTNAPDRRALHTAVWTGSVMIVWGGINGGGYIGPLNNGGRYNPSIDSWTATSLTNAPDGRIFHTTVWTGGEMIVWGGASLSGYLSTGGRYNPATDSWILTSTTNAPAGREAHTAMWTGGEMIVWGGLSHGGDVNTGGRYNPGTDNWTATSTTGAPAARDTHTAVWTGSEMIVWGGFNYPVGSLNTGGRYNPSSDSWTVTNTTGVPSARDFHTAIWTGSQMIVWGGEFSNNYNFLNTGGRYCAGAPGPTPTPTPVATLTATPTASPTPTPTATATPAGGCADDTWTATSNVNVPDARDGHTAVWTGSEMIIWGGDNHDGGRINNLDTGGRYNPAEDTWTPTSTGYAPFARSGHTGVWTGIEVIVWGGYNYPVGDLNTGGRYYPAIDAWTATSTANAPQGRIQHTGVWTGSEMIVWGGYGCGGNCNLNSGGRYDPSTDTWTATNPYAPERRWYHTAVWTGSEMIVWGGTNDTIYLNTGGRYNPNTDSWTATGVPSDVLGRVAHTAVWTGSEMIVWGGGDSTFNDCNTGGRYNPSADSWMATSLTNAPSPRESHSAVWTGSEMIVWGGVSCCPVIDFNTGGRYNLGTGSWVPTSTTNATIARYAHTAVWTGSEMVVWGGYNTDATIFLNTGGRYCAQSGATPTPTPTPTATATPTATPTVTATATPTATSTATFTPTPTPPSLTPTPTATPTPRASPTPRIAPTPRNRPTPPPRP